MTNTNDTSDKGFRPTWAAGLSAHADFGPANEDRLRGMIEGGRGIAALRRLAEVEAELAKLRAHRGAPDFLIDALGDVWFRTEPGGYSVRGEGVPVPRIAIEAAYAPVVEAWR